jgi:putative transposase
VLSGLCRLAGVSRQAYYRQRRRRRGREIDGEAVVAMVRAQRRMQPRIGTRKLRVLLAEQLEEEGISIGRDRLFELLRRRGMLVRRRRRGAVTTQSRHAFYTWPNLLRHLEPSMPHQVWVSDLTYLRTAEGFVYLALIMDAHSRKIVGYNVSSSLEAEGCLQALQAALGSLPAGARPIHHSDRGMQYCCRQYIDALQRRGCPISMTEQNHCYENAKAERLNGILKQEYGLDQNFRSKAQAAEAARQAVLIYNRYRPHIMLGYRTPEVVHQAA